MMTKETLRAEALERRTAERRAAHGEALARHFAIVERRKADAESVAQWLARFDAARMQAARIEGAKG